MFAARDPRSGGVSAGLVALLTTIAAFGLVLAGCGDTVIDSKSTEETLQASLEKSLHEKITSVDCPSDVKIEPGKTFTCEVNFPKGKQATATLKIRNKDADISIERLQPSN